MNRAFLTPFSVVLLLAFCANNATAEGVQWQDISVDDALAAAAEQGTMVLVDVYATWCGPCHRLDAEVFPTDEAGAATNELIAVKIDAETGAGPEVVERWHVVGYPTLLLLHPDGTEIDRVFGFMPADEFSQTVQSYREGRGTIAVLREQVAADPDNLELVLELGQRATVRGEYEEALTHLNRIIGADPDNAAGLRVQAHYMLGKYMYLRGSSDYPAAMAQFQLLMDEYGETDEGKEAVFQMAIAKIRAGDREVALAYLNQVVADAQSDASMLNSVAWMMFREKFELEVAIGFARIGLEAEPDADSLWDTLAEIQFETGDVAGAVESIQHSVTISPDEAYYQGQLERFSAALAAASEE